MAIITTVKPDDITTAMGVEPATGVERAQIEAWIADAVYLIGRRAGDALVNQGDIDYVVKQAVVAVAERPGGGAESQTVQVDDGLLTNRYTRGPRKVTITPEWWSLLGLAEGGNAFTIDMGGTRDGGHLPWCSLVLGALYCSCGASLTNYTYPLYEGGALS